MSAGADFSYKIGISVRPSFLYRHGLPVSAIQGTVNPEVLDALVLFAAPSQVNMPFETESLSDDGSILSHRSVCSLLSKYLDIIDISCMLNVVATVVLVQFYCLDQSRIEGLADSGRVLRLAERAAGDQLGERHADFLPTVTKVAALNLHKVDSGSFASAGQCQTDIGVEFALDVHRKYIRLAELLHTPYFGISDAYRPVAGRI